MTDREPVAPADPPRSQLLRPRSAPLAGDPNPNALLESASRGDGPPMSLTLATRPHHRATATDSPAADPLRAWLARLVAADLPAFAPAPLASTESRTPAESHAAARAAARADLFIVHAPDPSAGERVIVHITRLSSAGRVLILSPDPAAADRLAERLAKAGVVRALADSENPARPSPVVSKVTSAALGTGKVDQLKREASAAVAAAEARLTALDRAEKLIAQLAPLQSEIADLTARRDQIETAVRAAHVSRTPPPAAVDPALAARREKEAALATLRKQQAEVARKPGFFARLLGVAKHDAGDIENQIHSLEAEIASLTAHVDEFQAKADAETAAHAAEREKLIRNEVAAHRAETDPRMAELTTMRDRLHGEIDTLGPVPVRAAAEQQLAAARDRLADLSQNAPELVRRSLAEARVIVGTPASLQTDPVFDRGAGADPPFGLLVLDRAEELTEPDFVRLAKLASRWVLVGATTPHENPKPHPNGAPGRNGRSLEVPLVVRLARSLDRETWIHEADRLVCRLTHPTPEQRRGMTREPLLDHPEIELRFTADSTGEPVLAEVAFPARTAAADAKSFLFHQLGEVLLRPCGAVQWDHAPAALTACWPAAEHNTDAAWIDLEPGVRERVVGTGLVAFTAAVAFDPAAGWDVEKAEMWLARYLPADCAGRFASVPTETSSKRR